MRVPVRRIPWVAAGVLIALACGAPEPPQRIVLIVVDTLRRDHVGSSGGRSLTPRIDALARRGQVFTNAFSAYHQTTMSMAALFTGRTPSLEKTAAHARGTVWNGRVWCGLARFKEADAGEPCLPGSLPTLAEAMRGAGFWTIGVASNDLMFEPAGFARGFDDWIELGGEEPETLRRQGTRVNRQVAAALSRRPSDRFFLYVHYMDVHDYTLTKIPYADAVRAADAAVGELIGRLEQEGLLDAAVIVLSADHGEYFEDARVLGGTRGHLGNPSFDEVLEVPLIVALGVFEDTLAFVRSDDLYRMLLELVGVAVETPPDLAAQELYVSELRFLTYRKERWKSFEDRISHRFVLVDLERDPDELRDVSDRHPEVVRTHRARTQELKRALAASSYFPRLLTEEERQRLEALGYLEKGEPAPAAWHDPD